MVFSESRYARENACYGSIEVICGAMFSGKTEELIRRIRRAQLAGLDVVMFKHGMDTRYHETDIISHDHNSIKSMPITHSPAILSLFDTTRVVGIDEAQFFDNKLPNVCNELANKGVRVIVAGLNMDFKGRPFGPMAALMAIAEHVTKLHAVCMRCGAPASYSFRIVENDQKLLLGEKESYEPRCRSCFYRQP